MFSIVSYSHLSLMIIIVSASQFDIYLPWVNFAKVRLKLYLLKCLVSAVVCLRSATMFCPNMTLDTEL